MNGQTFTHDVNCDSHLLVIGVLAGLINEPSPNRGNFDAWSTDPSRGTALDLAKLDLVRRRNHILLAAIAAPARCQPPTPPLGSRRPRRHRKTPRREGSES